MNGVFYLQPFSGRLFRFVVGSSARSPVAGRERGVAVTRKSSGEIFHDQIGYWTWAPVSKTIAQSVNIPRVVAVPAGGSFDGDASKPETVLDESAKKGDPD